MIDVIKPVGRIGSYSEFNLHSIVPLELDDLDYKMNLLKGIVFKRDAKFIDIHGDVIRLIDGESFVGKGHQIIFSLPNMVDTKQLNLYMEQRYRESLLAMALERVVLQYVDISAISLAVLWCCSNDNCQPPVLHVLLDDSVSKITTQRIVVGLYMYIFDCGYEIDSVDSMIITTEEDQKLLDAFVAEIKREDNTL